jgi:TetR/AcrR family transcriptional repressor of nem operon
MATLARENSKTKLLDAAVQVIRQKGYEATTVDDICTEAEVSKGAFFHHFGSKEELALATADHFGKMAAELFAAAPHHESSDPLERLLGYVDLRAGMMHGDLPEFTCLFGTMVQEVYDTHPAIRKACDRHIREHAATVASDIAQAKREHAPRAKWSAEGLALFTQAVLQGSFILAKARRDPGIGVECLSHLRRYLELLFNS